MENPIKLLQEAEADLMMLETLFNIAKQRLVETQEEIKNIKRLKADEQCLEKMSIFLEKIIKNTGKIIDNVQKDKTLNEENKKTLASLAVIYNQMAVKILSEIDGLKLQSGREAIQLFNSIEDEIKELTKRLKHG